MIEKEMKYIITKDQALKAKKQLTKLFRHISRRHEKVTMYDFSNSFALEKEDARLRLKTTDKRCEYELSYKKRLSVTSEIKQEEEFTVLIRDLYNDLFQILQRLQLKVQSGYERIREKFTNNDKDTVTIDQFCFGYVLEIEGSKSFISKMASHLDTSNYESYKLSCDDYYAQWCRSLNIKALNFIPLKQDVPGLEK